MFFLFILLGGFAAASSSFAACEYLSSGDFSSGSGWGVKKETASWSISGGMLDVQKIQSGYASYAVHDFTPDGFFSLDTEVSVVSTTDEWDAVGIYFEISGDVYYSVNGYMTDSIAVFYYPSINKMKFWVWDMTNGEWVYPLGFQSVSGPVTSIGLSMAADGIVMRLNKHDTSLKLNGDFSGAYYAVSKVQLWAQGTGLHARFDNVCAAPYEVGDFLPGNAMPIPSGQEAVIITAPAATPATSTDPASANPFGFGPVASGGNILSLTAGLSGLSAPADLYVGIGIGAEIYLFDSSNNLHQLSTSAGLVKWRANTTGGINERLLPDFDRSLLPAGTYTFYFLMTPAGRLDNYRLWVTNLIVNSGGGGGGGGSPTVTDHAMESDIKQNIDLIFGTTSGSSGGLTEITAIFEDENVVTISPELDLMGILSGAPVPTTTITANFGSGYRIESGHVMAGSARIVLSNIQFNNAGLGANFSATFDNVTKDGAPFVNGQLSGSIFLTEGAGDASNVSGQIAISNLTVSDQQISGSIGISGTLVNLDLDALLSLDLAKLLETTGNITLTFSDFISGVYTINGGTVDIVSAGNGSTTVTTNLQTGAGPVNLNTLLTVTPTGAVISTTAPGTAGPYTLSINNVTLDQNTCASYPTAGTMSFTSGSTGKTGVVTFNGACDGTYGYTEQ